MSEKRSAILISLLLALSTLAIYWPVTGFDFINYDDPDYITYNSAIQHGLNVPSLKWAFTSSYASNWHPLTWISHTLDYSLFGNNSGRHHLVNLLFHAANSVLLFLALFRLTHSKWRSALVAVLFAWHPLHVESVAWVSERKDVLSAFFWLLTMLAYERYARNAEAGVLKQTSKRFIYYGLSLLSFALALLAKPMVVTLPFVLLLLDYWPLKRFTCETNRPNWQKLIVEKLPFFALAVGECLVTIWAQKSANSVVSTSALTLWERVSNALVSYTLYIWKTFCLVNLAVPYPYSHHWTFLQVFAAAVLLLLISAMTILYARKQPYLIVGWLWFLGTLVPAIGLVQVGIQFMADRYTYIPLIGIFIMIAWVIPAHWAVWPRPGMIFGVITAAVLFFLAAGTETQLQYWQNSITLFSHTIDVTPDNILAEYNVAEALARRGDTTNSILHYQKALAIKPNKVEALYNSQVQAHYNLGLIYRIQKDWPEAATQFRASVSSEPALAQNHINLGIALIGLGKTEEALAEFRIVAHYGSPQFDELQFLTLADVAYGETGQFLEAITAAEKSRDAAFKLGRLDLAAAAEKRLGNYRAGKF